MPKPVSVVYDKRRMPDVADCVAVWRTRHSNAVVKQLSNLERSFTTLAIFVLERSELINTQRVEALEYVLVFDQPLNGVVVSDDDLCIRLKCFGTIARVSNCVCQVRRKLFNVISP